MISVSRVVVLLLIFIISASCASAAGISFSGDARIRYIYKDNYGFGNFDLGGFDSWDSRVRHNIDAKSKAGCYAKVRLRIVDQQWGLDKPRKSSDTTWVDIAYVGVPIGSTVFEAGLLKSNISRFMEYDQSVDQAQLKWKMLNSEWLAFFRMTDEGTLSIFPIDRANDNDRYTLGVVINKTFLETYKAQLLLSYVDDQRDEYTTGSYIPSASGLFGSLFFSGMFKALAFETEAGFKAANTRQTRDESGIV